MKLFYEQFNVGKAKYLVKFHDGVSKHNDGSNFWDIRIFSNVKAKNQFIKELQAQGYVYRYSGTFVYA